MVQTDRWLGFRRRHDRYDADAVSLLSLLGYRRKLLIELAYSHFGNPTPDQTRAFTRVLQGHVSSAFPDLRDRPSRLMNHAHRQIAIETTPFPQGTKGDKLDPLARQFLWREGLNFGHGVGHGIGSYLSCVPPESSHIERLV